MTGPHDLHKLRRSALNPFFSKGSVRKLQPVIDTKTNQLLDRFGDFQRTGDVVVLNHAFAALTNGMFPSRRRQRLVENTESLTLRNRV
jgi:cytochrome P450